MSELDQQPEPLPHLSAVVVARDPYFVTRTLVSPSGET